MKLVQTAKNKTGKTAVAVYGESFTSVLADDVLNEYRPLLPPIVDATARVFVARARMLLSRKGTGQSRNIRVKTRKKKAAATFREHVSSTPGVPPALHMGKLRDSIKATKAKMPKWGAYARVGSRLKFAGALEFGGRVGRRKAVLLAPRPYIRPAERFAEAYLDRRMEQLP